MKTYNEEIQKSTHGDCDLINITDDLVSSVKKSKIANGLCTAFVVGSTAALTTIEYEPVLLKDIPELLNNLIPQNKRYHHDDTWGDGNGHAHLRSALIKTSFTIPIINSELTLGTWQQLILLDFDNRIRNRRIIIQIIGE